jgi:SAM-dependent methyltransferase
MGSPTTKILTVAGIVIAVVLVAKWFVLPRLLRAWLGVKPSAEPKSWRERVELRYQNLHTSVWMFAWIKLRLDPMFRELPELMKEMSNLRTVLDLGCGFGVAGSSLLEWFPELKVYGIDPNPHGVRMASLAFGQRGEVFKGGAPDFEVPSLPSNFDAVLVLDVIHFLSDAQLDLTLRRIRTKLSEGGYLVLRAPILPSGTGSFLWNLDKLKRKITGAFARYRKADQISDAIGQAGFTILRSQISGTPSHELHWFMATVPSRK